MSRAKKKIVPPIRTAWKTGAGRMNRKDRKTPFPLPLSMRKAPTGEAACGYRPDAAQAPAV